MRIRPWLARWLLNIYPPYLGAGVRVRRISADWQELDVVMKLHWYNRNAVGVHFGGSLYSMIDPHLMLLMMQQLGPGYQVWDQAARIEFLSPGRGEVRAAVRLPAQRTEQIRQEAADGRPCRPEFEILIEDSDGTAIARVHKTLYVRRISQQGGRNEETGSAADSAAVAGGHRLRSRGCRGQSGAGTDRGRSDAAS